jgi:hypothetical protein
LEFLNLKKPLAIFFLVLFLFNVGGYYLVFIGLKFQANRSALQTIANETYAGSDVVTLSIPLDLPYPIYEDEFKQVNGDFEYQGNHYRLIKQKLQNDKLIVVCIKDQKQTKLNHALLQVERAANDHNAKHTLSLLAKIFKDFQTTELTLLSAGTSWSREGSTTRVILHPAQNHPHGLAQPPRFC